MGHDEQRFHWNAWREKKTPYPLAWAVQQVLPLAPPDERPVHPDCGRACIVSVLGLINSESLYSETMSVVGLIATKSWHQGVLFGTGCRIQFDRRDRGRFRKQELVLLVGAECRQDRDTGMVCIIDRLRFSPFCNSQGRGQKVWSNACRN